MSDFDKEAEREKLREKYGEEEEKRKATEQMSELLLKGATMTNAHCTDCGDPIFRYDGQEFCPTCQKPVARDQPSEGDDHIEVADPSDDATVQFGDGAAEEDTPADEQTDAAANGQDTPAGGQADTAANGQDTPADGQDTPADAPADGASNATAVDAGDVATGAADQSAEETTQAVPSADPDRTPASGDTESPPRTEAVAAGAATDHLGGRDESALRSGDDASVTAELSTAESLLAETVTRFAQRAAEADDPRTAREHLAAAREAAEALDAVRF